MNMTYDDITLKEFLPYSKDGEKYEIGFKAIDNYFFLLIKKDQSSDMWQFKAEFTDMQSGYFTKFECFYCLPEQVVEYFVKKAKNEELLLEEHDGYINLSFEEVKNETKIIFKARKVSDYIQSTNEDILIANKHKELLERSTILPISVILPINISNAQSLIYPIEKYSCSNKRSDRSDFEVISQNSNKDSKEIDYKTTFLEKLERILDIISPPNLREYYLKKAYHDLGIKHSKQNNTEESIECFKKVLDLDQNIPNVYFNLGIQHDKQNNTEESIKCIEKAIELKPDNSKFYTFLGLQYEKDNKLSKSIKCFEKAAEVNPTSMSYIALGEKYSNQNRLEESIKCFEKALLLDQTKSYLIKKIKDEQLKLKKLKIIMSYHDLGIQHAKQKNTKESIECFKKALELDPNNPTDYFNLGIQHAKQYNTEESIKCLEKAFELKPDNITFYILLGLKYQKDNKLSKSIQCFEKAAKVIPTNLPHYVKYSLGEKYCEQQIIQCTNIIFKEA